MGMHVIIIGNPVEGFQYIGPFKTRDDAINWAQFGNNVEADWWVAPLSSQDEITEAA